MAFIGHLTGRRSNLEAGNNLAQRVAVLRESRRCAVISFGDLRSVVIRGDIGRYYDPSAVAANLVPWAHAGGGQWQMVDRHDIELRDCPDDGGRPLDELLWTLAHTGYSEATCCLQQGARRDDVIQLQRWPNLTRVAHSANTHRLAALFSARPTSVVLAARVLELDEVEVLQFYTAALQAGLVRRLNRPLATPDIRRHRHQDLLGAMMRHLRGHHRVGS